ncbi:MAG: hypothetical protein HC876_22650 [Chloroflexaceae bacterium]|nr:hypothetical protein [Chloroflexaceae bacterium]NJO08091.1 hypothetical protein [Chloroflexaceae bacterium]
MPTYSNSVFLEIVRQQGFDPRQAAVALETLNVRLLAHGHITRANFYVYRVGGRGINIGDDAPLERPRVLLAFATADTALSFAQRSGLGNSPRLVRMHISQLLAIMLQRPAIRSLLVANEPLLLEPERYLPVGLRFQRNELLDMLKGA